MARKKKVPDLPGKKIRNSMEWKVFGRARVPRRLPRQNMEALEKCGMLKDLNVQEFYDPKSSYKVECLYNRKGFLVALKVGEKWVKLRR